MKKKVVYFECEMKRLNGLLNKTLKALNDADDLMPELIEASHLLLELVDDLCTEIESYLITSPSIKEEENYGMFCKYRGLICKAKNLMNIVARL